MKLQKQLFLAIVLLPILVIASLDASRGTLQIGDPAAKINGSEWINSAPLTVNDFVGQVVLVEFWTYG